VRLASGVEVTDNRGVDPEYEARSRTGRRIIGVSVAICCFGWLFLVVAFLALWQFLAPKERTVPPRPPIHVPE
jgi:hypothetical protein